MKKIPFEYLAIDLTAGVQLGEAYRKLNPMGHLPALEIDGELAVESVAILELLDELVPEPRIYPKEPFARAHVRALVEIINSGIQPLQNLVVLKRIGDENRDAWLKHFLPRGLAAFEGLMAAHEAKGIQGPFAYGATLTAADCALVPQVYSAKRFGVALDAYPRLMRAYEAALALPEVAGAAPEVQPDAPKS